MNLKKILIFAGVALVLFLLVTQPNQAAGMVQGILGTLKGFAEAIVTFVRQLFI